MSKTNFSQDAFRRTLPFRTTGGITRRKDKDFHNLHPDLPLIEVHGFFGKPGSSGSPVFASTDGTFIGLIILNHCEKNYILPTDFIIHYMGGHNIEADGLRKGVDDCGSSHHGNVSFQKMPFLLSLMWFSFLGEIIVYSLSLSKFLLFMLSNILIFWVLLPFVVNCTISRTSEDSGSYATKEN